ncbi:MAG TPA: hypothetical protein VGI32_08985 [Steroidobacteraceae bacterium]|jgi:hypothetical protein
MKLRVLGTAVSFSIALAACGGGNTGNMPMPGPGSSEYNMQAGINNMVAMGLTSNVNLSGTVNVSGVSTPFTGSGTYVRQIAAAGSFDGAAAMSQVATITGTITAAGQTSPYSTSVVDYFSSGNSELLGEDQGGEYDVAQAPLVYPGMIVGGSTGTLGTLSRYTDKTMSVSLGTVQVSYSVMSPVDPGSPIAFSFTYQIYDTHNTLTETDVMTYGMSPVPSSEINFISASAQRPSGTLMVSSTGPS